jgi:hypothetical protein
MNEIGAHDNGRWRLSKDIPVSVVGFIILQTITFTWFLASQNGKLTAVIDDNASNKIAAYTKDDARHEREFMEQKFLLLQNKDDEMTRRLALVEAQINELRTRVQVK